MSKFKLALANLMPKRKSILLLTLFSFAPLFALGANDSGILPSKIVACTGADDCNTRAFLQSFYNLIKFIIGIVIIASALVFAWAGFMYMTAQGDENKVKKAHSIFYKVIVGLIVALVAWLIVSVLLGQLTGKDLDTRVERYISN